MLSLLPGDSPQQLLQLAIFPLLLVPVTATSPALRTSPAPCSSGAYEILGQSKLRSDAGLQVMWFLSVANCLREPMQDDCVVERAYSGKNTGIIWSCALNAHFGKYCFKSVVWLLHKHNFPSYFWKPDKIYVTFRKKNESFEVFSIKDGIYSSLKGAGSLGSPLLEEPLITCYGLDVLWPCMLAKEVKLCHTRGLKFKT